VADQTDQQLLARMQRNDPNAIEYLIDRYQRPLFNFAYRFLGNTDAAADICQFTFIQFYTHFQTMRTNETIRAWLFQVARNRCLDELRRQHTIPFSQMGLDFDTHESPLDQIVDTKPLPEDIVDQADLQQLLGAAISSLPPKYREVVALRYTAELNFAEIGQILGIPEATAKTHFHRAKPLLRAFLRDHGWAS